MSFRPEVNAPGVAMRTPTGVVLVSAPVISATAPPVRYRLSSPASEVFCAITGLPDSATLPPAAYTPPPRAVAPLFSSTA